MPRPIWKGAVAFGLVTIPVNLYPATKSTAEISFRQLHKKDHAPIDYRRFCSAENIEVQWADIGRGFEYAKGQFVVMTDEDFEKARVPATQTIEIRQFVRAEEIEFAHFESPYWLEPTPQGRKAYALLRQAMAETGLVAIGTLVMRQREHLVALRASGQGVMLTTMRFADELRGVEELNVPGAEPPSEKELGLARQLIEAITDDWKPEQFHDTYREVLRGLIEQKLQGQELKAPALAPRPEVADLVEALRQSLQGAKKPLTKAEGKKAAPRREPAKKRRSA